MPKKLILGSRASFLAKIQTFIVKEKFSKVYENLDIIINYSKSDGDHSQSPKAWKNLGYGIFTSLLTSNLINNDCDCVVHSLKDLPILNRKTNFITLERDDPRDVLLIKKHSIYNKKILLASSSPRRKSSMLDLKHFLPNVEKVLSRNIRGNVSTRLEKIINNKNIDGIFMAKAAIDRIFKYGNKVDKTETEKFINFYEKFIPIILPLSQFPAAAGQGIIAVEYRKNDNQTYKLIKKISDQDTLEISQLERRLLKKYGGGCGLDIGITVEKIKNQKFLFSKGIDARSNKKFHKNGILDKTLSKKTKYIFPKNLKDYQIFNREKISLKNKLFEHTIVLTRSELLLKNISKKNYLITSGISTWKKLNHSKKLIQASFDGLGENYRVPEVHYRKFTKIMKITYKGSLSKNKSIKQISGYNLIPHINENTMNDLFKANTFFWMSFSAFSLAKIVRPEILKYHHACGPGSTYELLSEFIPKNRLHLFYNYEDFKYNILKR